RLPPTLSTFADSRLNEDLYFWLAAVAAQLPRINSWFVDNQRATLQLLEKRPGLQRRYQALVEAVTEERIRYWAKLSVINEQERQIQQALNQPGSVTRLTKTQLSPFPVPLWLYPPPGISLDNIAAEESEEEETPGSAIPEQANIGRKQANREDDSKD